MPSKYIPTDRRLKPSALAGPVETTSSLQKKLGSTFARIIPSHHYNPLPKPPSKRDLHRAAVKGHRQGIH